MTIIRSRAQPVAAAAATSSAGVANPEVEAILGEWRTKLERAHAEGRQAGLAESAAQVAAAGKRASEAEAQAEARLAARRAELEDRLGRTIAALEQSSARLVDLEKQLVGAAEREVVRLAGAIATRILRREIETDPGWMEPVLAAALAQVPDRRGVSVRMQPDDAAAARAAQERITAGITGLERLNIQDDPGLAKGTCLLLSQGTRIDASIASSWERVTATLLVAAPDPPMVVRNDGAVPEATAEAPSSQA